jgi:hypothetical protein
MPLFPRVFLSGSSGLRHHGAKARQNADNSGVEGILEAQSVSVGIEAGVCAGTKGECKYPLPELVAAFSEGGHEDSRAAAAEANCG